METVLAEEMLQYFSQLNQEQQKSVIDLIKTFVKNQSEFAPVTLEEYTKELEEADAEIEAGDYITHEEVKKRLLKQL